MRLTDIVSNLNLDLYPIIAMIFFLAAFGIILWGVVRTPKSESERQANIPLQEDYDMTQVRSKNGAAVDSKGVNHG